MRKIEFNPDRANISDPIPEVLLQRATGGVDVAFCNANRKKRTIPEMPEYYAAKGCTEKVLDETIE